MRRTEQVDMPLSDAAMLLHPEAALLKWDGIARRIDIGQLCYLKRDTSLNHRSHHTFDETSLDEERVQAVRKLVEYFSEAEQCANVRPATMLIRVRTLVWFVNWADKLGLQCKLFDKVSMASAFSDYAKHQRELVSQNRLNRNSAANKLRGLRTTLEDILKTNSLACDVLRMQNSRVHVESTAVPDKMSQAALVSWCTSLFEAISKRVLEFGEYPFSVDGTDYQKGTTRRVWMLPTRVGRTGAGPKNTLRAWNLETGEVRTYHEIKSQTTVRNSKWPGQRAHTLRTTALAQLQRANKNCLASIRLSHAVTASYCFGVLFLAETGINMAQLLNMEWSAELEKGLKSSSVVRQHFREIKYRAGGRIVSFQVGLGFLSKLRTYLRMREYLLQGVEMSLLFVALAHDNSPVGFSEQFVAALQARLDGLDIVLPRLSARKWRAAKQDWVVSNHGPVVAAKVMSQTLDTALRSYSNGTDAAHRAEMGAFLASVEQTVLRSDERSSEDVESAVGACKDFNSPKSISPSVAIKPDCHSYEGCLFCSNYRVHADATDIRKLLSCRYCIRITCNRGSSLDEFDRFFGAVLRRIEFLIGEIRKRGDILVSQIQEDVDTNGNLDFFWANKLEQLFELGLA